MTWPNISKMECPVLILRPSMFRAAVVKRLLPANFQRMKTPNGKCRKSCRWLKVTKTQKTLEKTKTTLNKKQFSESLGWDPPSKEFFFVFFCFFVVSKVFFCFSQVFPFFFVFAGFFKVFLVFLGFPEGFFFIFAGFSKVFPKCGVLQGNWHESQAKLSKRLWECRKTSVKHFKRLS